MLVEIVPADSYTIEYDLVQSEVDSCKNADQLNQEIEKRIRNTLPCIKKSECEMQKLQVLNCDSSADRNKRDVNSKATIRVTIFRGGMQTTQQGNICTYDMIYLYTSNLLVCDLGPIDR